jgi:hypothetical protein
MTGTPTDHSPTYAEQVSRILQKHCVACHQPGGIGPFPLTNYAEARAFAREIRLATQSRKEPPWFALAGYGEFQNQRQLTIEEIKTLGAWFDAGTPLGDQKDLPPKQEKERAWAYGPPDVILTVAKPYTVAGAVGEDIRCFVTPIKFPEPKPIRAIDVRPGDPSVVYHVRVFADVTGLARRLDGQGRKPGYDCSLNMRSLFTQKLLGEWEAGMTFPSLPESIARGLPKGADVVLEIHYHQTYKTTSDRTTVALYFQQHVQKFVHTAAIVNRKIQVPPDKGVYQATAEWVAPQDIVAIGVTPHMHRLGTAMRIQASIPGGQMRDLVWVNRYDFHWQTSYMFKEPIPIPRGTVIRVEAFYDNSEQNMNLNPHRPLRESRWGNRLEDEMLAAFVEYVDRESPSKLPVR